MNVSALPEEYREAVNREIDIYNGENEDGKLSKEEFVKMMCCIDEGKLLIRNRILR